MQFDVLTLFPEMFGGIRFKHNWKSKRKRTNKY